ncbi:MAG: tetraacyldisaccharide 4'-kinase [Bdellovibrionota bacterium]
MMVFYPLSLLYGFFVYIRETLYKYKILPSYKVKTKVLSVGNLTFGGTGKTPTVDFLLENLKKDKKIAVLSRGYGRTTSGFFKVNPADPKAASVFGDEPVLLAKNHPEVPVYVCENRVEGCEQIEKEAIFDLIIADDAFQHLKLKKDIDVVVIDATEKFQNYNYPPVGRARNSFSYLKRADFVFLTKTNLCSTEELNKIREVLKKYPVAEFESQIDSFYDLKSNQKIQTQFRDVTLVSGIGKPKTFEDLIKKNYPNLSIKKHYAFKDHHAYKESDILRIKAESENGILLTTEKDAVKLQKFSEQLNFLVAKLKFVNQRSMDKFFYEVLH